MAEYTQTQITIVECPPQNVARVSAILYEHNLIADPSAPLVLGEQFSETMSTGTFNNTFVNALIPLCSFDGWEDPYAEWLGEGTISLLGRTNPFSYNCGRDGTILLNPTQILEAIATNNLGNLLGTEITTTFDELYNVVSATETILAQPPLCPQHGGPWSGDETCQTCTDDDDLPRPLPADLA